MSDPLPPGYVRLTCGDPALDLVCLLGPEPPQLSGGVGGWSVVARPREVGMTVWEGSEPYTLSLSLMLDRFAEGRSIEAKLRQLTRVGRGDRESPPGTLRVRGLPLPDVRWFIETIDYGEPIRRTTDAARVRQPLVLQLREFVSPEFLRRRRKPFGKSSSKTTIIRAQEGDTAAKIAKRRRLKSWTVLRKLNKKVVKKANQKIKQGTKLRVPAVKPQKPSGKDKDDKKR